MEIIKFVQSFSNPFLDHFFQLVTMLGEELFFMLILSIIYWCIHKEFGYRLGLAYLSTVAVNTALKEMFRVPRPIGRPGIRSLRIETADGSSFPSGHSQCTATFWTSVMIQFRKKWIYVVGAILTLAVGFSRIYLGVHWLTDVIGGIIIGVLWVFISNKIFDHAQKTGNPAIFLSILIPAILGMVFIHTANYYKVSGTAISFVVGYLIETRYINFQPKTVFWKQLIKLAAGFGGLFGIRFGLKFLLPPVIFSDFCRYFLMGIWLTVIAPWLFKMLFANKK